MSGSLRNQFVIPKSEYILPVFMLPLCLAHGIALASETGELPDKSAFNLFNPVPENLMRELAPDRPDQTESPYTVDAGHFQLEMDLVSYTHDHDRSGGGDVRTDAWSVAPLNLKLGLLNQVDIQFLLDTQVEN